MEAGSSITSGEAKAAPAKAVTASIATTALIFFMFISPFWFVAALKRRQNLTAKLYIIIVRLI
jgi:hypothetical protein